jgi:sugar O-acyltransferase (sialic acid O-acetyltransferase NeuD family)
MSQTRNRPIFLLGGGGHALVVAELAEMLGWQIAGYYDDNVATSRCTFATLFAHIPQLGTLKSLSNGALPPELHLFCCIGDNRLRRDTVAIVEANAQVQNTRVIWVTLVHPKATVSHSALLGAGTIVCAGAVVEVGVNIGKHSIVNTNSSITHECQIGDYVHIAPGSQLCGKVSVQSITLVGAGSVVLPRKAIGADCTIGANSTVLSDVASNKIVCGIVKKSNAMSSNITPAAARNESKTLDDLTRVRKVAWLANKQVNWQRVQSLLEQSAQNNHYTNYGPCVRALEERIRKEFMVGDTKAVVVVNNGSSAVHALVSAINQFHQKQFHYGIQAFTFPTSAQGSLKDHSELIDISLEQGALDLDFVDLERIDGVVVTNVLGNVCDLPKYEAWAKQHQKILLFDNAATSLTVMNGKNCINYGTGCTISFHHTKPIGFGEGGAVIVDRQYEHELRKIINFGYDVVKADLVWLPDGNNYKMSDLSAAFIYSYLDKFEEIRTTHARLLHIFRTLSSQYNFEAKKIRLIPSFAEPFLACFAVQFPFAVDLTDIPENFAKVLVVRKYYKPLSSAEFYPKAHKLYNHILCFPCHVDMDDTEIAVVIECIYVIYATKERISTNSKQC